MFVLYFAIWGFKLNTVYFQSEKYIFFSHAVYSMFIAYNWNVFGQMCLVYLSYQCIFFYNVGDFGGTIYGKMVWDELYNKV